VADSTPCEDGDVCTSETGEPQTPDHCFGGVCTGIPVDCDDGQFCNGEEICESPDIGCIPGTQDLCTDACVTNGKKPTPPEELEWQFINTGDSAFDSVCMTVIHPKEDVIFDATLGDGDYFITTRTDQGGNAKLNPRLDFVICSTSSECTDCVSFSVHTSCSLPLNVGDSFPEGGDQQVMLSGQIE
jgi:hypothetical protein